MSRIAWLAAFVVVPSFIGFTARVSAESFTSIISSPDPDADSDSTASEPVKGGRAKKSGEDRKSKEDPKSTPDRAKESKGKRKSSDGRSKESGETKKESSKKKGATSRKAPTSGSSADDEDAEKNVPQVEIFIPSVARLAEEVERSRTGGLLRELSGLMPLPRDDTGEGFDFDALYGLGERISKWPDTSLAVTVYSQDNQGRPRWTAQLDWSLPDLAGRVAGVLEDERASKILKDFALKKDAEGRWRIELPDTVIAVLSSHHGRSLISSAADLAPPEKLFGRPSSKSSSKKSASLIYCRLNLEASDGEGGSFFTMLSGVSDIRYAGNVDNDGRWRERFSVRWNPFVGALLKATFKKTERSYQCPRDSLAAGVCHLGMSEGLADSIAGLPMGTIGGRADGEMAIAVVAGEGFLPIPDMFYQFRARRVDKIVESIREAMEKDAEERRDDDRKPAWHELEIGDDVVFVHDPSVDNHGSFSMATFRTVVFFDRQEHGEKGGDRLILAQTSNWPEEIVPRWRSLLRTSKSRVTLPSSDKAHWQLTVNWSAIYALADPYLTILSGMTEGARPPGSVEKLRGVLCNSVVDVRILYTGLDVRHGGPVPIGAAYVPAVAAMALSKSAEWGSEAYREQVACRNLRALHHHAKLFKRDFGRWPANVAELDGYVDFSSHPYLLTLQPKDEGFLKGFVSVFTTNKKSLEAEERDEDEIDDSLYEVEWSPDAWMLRMRAGEFRNYATICIDEVGEIHRVPMANKTKPDGAKEPKKGESDDKKLAGRGH